MVCIAITGALLTAAAVAIDASMTAYSVNQSQADTMHRARLALHRLSTSIRTGVEHAPIGETQFDEFVDGATVTDAGLSLTDEAGTELTYRYDAAAQQLIVREDETDHVLLRNVTAFSLDLVPARSAVSIKTGGGFDLLSRATITLTVRYPEGIGQGVKAQDAARPVTLSTTVTPRRAI